MSYRCYSTLSWETICGFVRPDVFSQHVRNGFRICFALVDMAVGHAPGYVRSWLKALFIFAEHASLIDGM